MHIASQFRQNGLDLREPTRIATHGTAHVHNTAPRGRDGVRTLPQRACKERQIWAETMHWPSAASAPHPVVANPRRLQDLLARQLEETVISSRVTLGVRRKK